MRWAGCRNPKHSRAGAMARASRICVFCLQLIVGTEALKLRKLHARTHKQTAHKLYDNLRYTNSVYKFRFPGDRAARGVASNPPPPHPSSSEVTERVQLWIRKTNQMSIFVFFISLLINAQHVSGNMCPSSGADDCVML